MRSWVDHGRAALVATDWSGARVAFESALRQAESPEAFEGLAAAAWWLDDRDVVLRARERAFDGYQRRGERIAAARVAIARGEDCLSFEGAAAEAQRWLTRAAELLGGIEPGPEHGWLAVAQADLALETSGAPARVRGHAEAAAALGRTLGLIDLETVARALLGAGWIVEGHLVEGMRLLEVAASSASAGKLSDPAATGATLLYMITSCNRIRDFDRAAQWCERAEELGRRLRHGALLAACRTQLADGLIARGDWERAERELENGVRFFAKARPGMQPMAQVRLAALRRRQGWNEDARGILATVEGDTREGAYDHRLLPLELAALALQAGDAPQAVEWAERYLRDLGEPRRIERLAGLEVLVRARLDQREPVPAALLRELGSLASAAAPLALVGAIRFAEGLVALAAGQPEAARVSLAAAVELLERGGAQYDAARARIELARCYTSREQDAAAVRELERAWRTLAKMGLEGRPAPSAPSLENLSKREVEVLHLLARGQSNIEIAAQLHISEFTVKRHVENILRKLEVPTRAAAAAYAARTGHG